MGKFCFITVRGCREREWIGEILLFINFIFFVILIVREFSSLTVVTMNVRHVVGELSPFIIFIINVLHSVGGFSPPLTIFMINVWHIFREYLVIRRTIVAALHEECSCFSRSDIFLSGSYKAYNFSIQNSLRQCTSSLSINFMLGFVAI